MLTSSDFIRYCCRGEVPADQELNHQPGDRNQYDRSSNYNSMQDYCKQEKETSYH